ncbi:hypothetical protein C5167_003927, partial [Papaver somniferum]
YGVVTAVFNQTQICTLSSNILDRSLQFRFHISAGSLISQYSSRVMNISPKDLVDPQVLASSITSCHS